MRAVDLFHLTAPSLDTVMYVCFPFVGVESSREGDMTTSLRSVVLNLLEYFISIFNQATQRNATRAQDLPSFLPFLFFLSFFLSFSLWSILLSSLSQ